MPELPEVEVLARHLDDALRGKIIREVSVHRAKSIRPTSARAMRGKLVGTKFRAVMRRAKYLLFELKPPRREPFILLGHLGMTGRMYLQPQRRDLPKHAAVSLTLCRKRFVFEDTRYFGRITLDLAPLETLGPEPLEAGFDGAALFLALRRCTQAIKPKLLDQSLLAGVGNIYASEALFGARIRPTTPSGRISRPRMQRLVAEIKAVLQRAIDCGGTTINDYLGSGDGGRFQQELAVYGRAGEGCIVCDKPITNKVLSGRSTFYCTTCQH